LFFKGVHESPKVDFFYHNIYRYKSKDIISDIMLNSLKNGYTEITMYLYYNVLHYVTLLW